MPDRLKFWWRSLSRGAGQLNNAAGWLGLVVLILGVAVGIAVPLVFRVSLWFTAVVLMGLFIVVMLEGAYRVWHTTEQEREAARSELERRFAAMRYALQPRGTETGLIRGSGNTMAVQIGVKVDNTSDEYMRYEVEDVSTTIEGRCSPNGPIGTAVISPHGTNTFIPPAVEGVPLNWKTGTLSVTLRYGHASGQPQYRVHWEFDVQGRRQPGLAQSDIELDIGMVNAPEVEDI